MADEIGTQSSPRMHSSPHNHHPLEQPEEDENEGSAPTISASRVNFSNHNTPTNNSNMNGLSNAVIDVEALELKDNSTDVADGPINSIRRKWEYFPGKNHFYCDGRVMTAPSIRFCVLSFALILVTFSLFIVFDAPFLTERLTVAIPIAVSILFVSVVVNMVKTSFSDPGILPRASQQEADHLEKSYYSTNFRPPPRTKDIVVNGQVIKSKYCFTCKMFRPPRASHCGICDNCVDRFDHHCPFLGNCIGKRNYRSFYAFIVSLSFLAVFILSASIAHLVMLSKEKNNFLEALRDSPSSAVVILISFFGMWTVIGLTGFHTYLIAVEQTTNEDIKGLFGRANAKNPFSHGNFCQNCCFVLCGPSQPSLIDPRGLATAEFIASLPRKGDHNGMLSPEKTQQHTQVVNKLATNNGINGEFHQPNHGGSFIGGGTNKIFREHPPSAQTVQPIQHQPLQFSSSSSSTAPLEVNPDVHSSKSSVSGLPSLPPEEKMLLKGPIRNGRMDYRQTIPDSSGIEEIQLSPQEEPVISPSAASTVSLSTLSTSNLSTNNDYDVVVSPVGGGDGDRGVVGKVPSLPPSVRHQFNKNTRLNNGNHSKRLFPSSSIDQLDDVIDPSDFDDDLDMPSLSNINEIEISRRPFNNVRASNNNKSVFSGGDHLTKSTRSLPSTSLEENFNGRASAADIHKIHQLPITTSKSSVNNIKASSSSVRNLLVNKSGPGRGTKSHSGDGVNSNNKKRSHDSTMQNSPLHLDTIM